MDMYKTKQSRRSATGEEPVVEDLGDQLSE